MAWTPRAVDLPPDKAERFRELWLSGAGERRIALELGVRAGVVYVYARLMGLAPRRPPPPGRKVTVEALEDMVRLWREGLAVKEIASRLGVSAHTVQEYLRAMGLRRRAYWRCPEIPAGELERAVLEGLSDGEIAARHGVSVSCVVKARRRLGLNRRRLAARLTRERYRRVAELVAGLLAEKGYVTTAELREKHGITMTRRILRELQEAVEGLRILRLKYTSTSKYTVLPPRFNRVAILYVRGREAEVAGFLKSILVEPAPPYVLKRLLRGNGAPRELLEHI